MSTHAMHMQLSATLAITGLTITGYNLLQVTIYYRLQSITGYNLLQVTMIEECRCKTLEMIPPGTKCVVRGVCGTDRGLCQKLLSMGFVIGTAIDVMAAAPLSGPIKVRALGYELSLRISEARHVEVSPI